MRANYLASPPLVVAYALAGSMNVDLTRDSLGKDKQGKDVYLADIWPKTEEVHQLVDSVITAKMFKTKYASVFDGDANWRRVKAPAGLTYAWDMGSTYVQNPPYFEGLTKEPVPVTDIENARVLALFLDSITTDHISPAGSIKAASPAGKYLTEHQVRPADFNQYGTRRGNHEVMMRGTFANIRIKNQMVKDEAGNVVEGGFTLHQPDGERLAIYDAAMKYEAEKVPLVVFAGKEYGTGSSRDWAAKGTKLLGVRAVIAQSFERIHRSNLVGMGVLPLVFEDGDELADAGPEGRRNGDDPGPERGPEAAPDVARRDPALERRGILRAADVAASTRWTSSNISATAGFWPTCCGNSRPNNPLPASRRKRGRGTMRSMVVGVSATRRQLHSLAVTPNLTTLTAQIIDSAGSPIWSLPQTRRLNIIH